MPNGLADAPVSRDVQFKMRFVALVSLTLSLAGPLHAQRRSELGSFAIATGTAIVGAAAGFAFTELVVPRSGGPCDLRVASSCEPDQQNVGLLMATTAVGGMAGAVLGRKLARGEQNVALTAAGALLGAGLGVLLTQDDLDDVELTVAIAIPTGLFAALAGWKSWF